MIIHRILIVEDHAPTRNLLRSILARKGHEVTVAETMAEGLALLEFLPDCVVLDLDLPDGPGETVLRRVREQNLSIRVAVSSGCDDATRWGIVRALDPDAVLMKPIQVADLCEACAPGGHAR